MKKRRHGRDTSAHSDLSRRRLLKGGGALMAAGGFAGVARADGIPWFPGVFGPPPRPHPGGPRPKGPDLVLTNGKIHTMDPSNRVVSQVLIRDGRIAEVGSGIGTQSGNVRVINLRGKTVIPGLIDSHTHIVLVGNRPGYSVLLEDLLSVKDVVARLKAASRSVPDGEVITCIGPISAMQLQERRLPNLTELDAVNRPVYIQAAQGGTVTNTLGVQWFAANGVTTGINTTTGAITGGGVSAALLALRKQQDGDDVRKRNSLAALQFYTTLGVTTQHDQGAFQFQSGPNGPIVDGLLFDEDNFSIYNSFLALDRDGALPARLRFNYLYMDQDPNSEPLSERLKNAFQFFGNDMMKSGAIGEFVAPDPTDPMVLVTAGMPPVANNAGNTRWLTAAMKVGQAGWRAESHSLTTGDFKAEIDGYLLVNQQFPIDDLRWVVAHVPFITPDYIAKLKSIGGGLKVGWGPTRTGTKVGPPYRTILNSGINVGYHSDGGDITVINPWLNFYTIITGKNLQGDSILDPAETLTRQEVLWLATVANKWFIGEDDLGSIEVGNHADLAVLDRDYFSVPDDQITQIRSLLTVVGGNVVYDAGVV